ncbi:MAG: nitroreductase family deazaflavin-dependent oxidoreductase [Candidatus Dormiibacterota bacterium]
MTDDSIARPEAFTENLIAEYRANQGVVGGMFAGSPLMLLTTRGARSGQERVNPVVFTRDGDDLVVIASKGGAPTSPAWYHNLVAHPQATVELGAEKFGVQARVTEGEERDRLFAAQAALMPNFAEYQEKTTRRIPVVVLHRV